MSNGILQVAAHAFACAMARLDGAAAARVAALGARIPAGALAGPGREAMPHVTVRWGLDDGDAPAVAAAVAGWRGPARIRLGRTSSWETPDGDCVKIDVISPDLADLRRLIEAACPAAADTFPFDPHITLAYVAAGRGAEFAGWDDLAGVVLEFTELVLGLTNDAIVPLPLGGLVAASGFDPSQPREENGRWVALLAGLPKLADGSLSAAQILGREEAVFHAFPDEGEVEVPLGDQRVRIDELVPTQDEVDPRTVRGYMQDPEHPAIDVYERGGRRFIADGHHRVIAAKLRGDTTIAATLTRIERTRLVGASGFDPNQPRDEAGRWTDTGTGDPDAHEAAINRWIEAAAAEMPKMDLTERKRDGLLARDELYRGDTTLIGGLAVRTRIPNTDSISATLNDGEYEELPGIRAVPLASLGLADYRAADDRARVDALAERIKDSGEISPLIVVRDHEGNYTLEGNHRARALQRLGHTHAPALVIIEYPAMKPRALVELVGAAFDPTQPRDRIGRWTDAGSWRSVSATPELLAIAHKDSSKRSLILSDMESDVMGVVRGGQRRLDYALDRFEQDTAAGSTHPYGYSEADVAAQWSATREYLRKTYGENLILFRADAPPEEHTDKTRTVYMGGRGLVRKFATGGRRMRPYRVKTDDVLAVYVPNDPEGRKSPYYEFIVRRPKEGLLRHLAEDQALAVVGATGFDPNQPRDEDGRWADEIHDDNGLPTDFGRRHDPEAYAIEGKHELREAEIRLAEVQKELNRVDISGKLRTALINERDFINKRMFHYQRKQPVTFFHGTSEQAWAAIQKEGLVPLKGTGADAWASSRGWQDTSKWRVGDRTVSVYVTSVLDDAELYASYAAEMTGSRGVVLEVRMPAKAARELYTDEQSQSGTAKRYKGTIPPEWITMRQLADDAEDPIFLVLLARDTDVRGLADGDLPSRYRLSKFAAEHAAELVQAPRRVRTLIRNEVRKALRNGEGPEGIADRLDGLVAMEPARIDTIARTEYAIARTGARLEEAAALYGDTEVVKGWVLGDESCPRCIALAGQEVPIDEDFVADDGERVAGPPLHPNCDCDIEIREVAERERLRAAVRLVGAEWDESKHPRVPAGSDEGGQFTSAGREFSDADLRKRIEQAHFSLLANGVFSGRDDVRVDLSTMKPADRLAALQVARSEINLFYSKERYGSRMAAYDAFLKKYAADPEGGLAEGLASGLITREKAGEFTYSVASSFPYRNVLDGLDAAGRDEFERGLVEVLQTGTMPFDASAHDLSRAGWTHAELERFADRVQAAGGTFPKWTSENKYPAIHKLAGDLAFFTRDYESFRMEAFSGWASVHGSDTAVTLRAAAEEAFPSTNGTTFYRVSAIRGEQGVEKLYSQRAVENIRKLKAETESFYLSKFKGKDPAGKPLEVYRGVGGHIEAYAPGSIESWTRDSRTVKRFGLMMSDDRTGNQYSALRTKVTYNDVLWSYESAAGKPGWPEEEVLKGKKEFVLIGQRLREVESEKREGK